MLPFSQRPLARAPGRDGNITAGFSGRGAGAVRVRPCSSDGSVAVSLHGLGGRRPEPLGCRAEAERVRVLVTAQTVPVSPGPCPFGMMMWLGSSGRDSEACQ